MIALPNARIAPMLFACLLVSASLAEPAAATQPTHRDVEYAKVARRSLRLDIYLPEQDAAAKTPVIVWVHGGAWRAGSKDEVPVLHWLSKGFAVASVDYRLSPEARFPAQVHDIKAAIRFLRAHAEKYHLDPHRFAIAGSSAGGHLAALVGVSNDVQELEGEIGGFTLASSDVQAIVSFYGASNLQTILSQSTEHGLKVRVPALELLLGGQPDEKPELAQLASPVTHIDADDPPLWLIHGDADPQMPLEQSRELAAKYRQHSLPVRFDVVEGGKHGGDVFYTQQRLSQVADAVKNALPVRLLFAGSSSTYWNDLPGEVAKLVSGKVTGHDRRPVTAQIVGRSGSDIRAYLDPDCNYQYGVKPGQSFLEKVRDEKFDYVCLMVVCRFITGDGEGNLDGAAHRAAVTKYCQAIRDAGGEPIFYEMGWGKVEREAEGRRRIMELATQNKIKLFAPCSSAWARVYEERPDLALQHPQDSSHPGDLGHFLNLACFYAALTETSPEGKLPREFHVWPHLNKEQKEKMQDKLDAAYAKFEPDDYQSRLPEWMRRNAGAGIVGKVSEEDGRYLERVAWEVWQVKHKELDRSP